MFGFFGRLFFGNGRRGPLVLPPIITTYTKKYAKKAALFVVNYANLQDAYTIGYSDKPVLTEYPVKSRATCTDSPVIASFRQRDY